MRQVRHAKLALEIGTLGKGSPDITVVAVLAVRVTGKGVNKRFEMAVRRVRVGCVAPVELDRIGSPEGEPRVGRDDCNPAVQSTIFSTPGIDSARLAS